MPLSLPEIESLILTLEKRERSSATTLRRKRADSLCIVVKEKWPNLKLYEKVSGGKHLTFTVDEVEAMPYGESYKTIGFIYFGINYPYRIQAGGFIGKPLANLPEVLSAFEIMFVRLRKEIPNFTRLSSWLVQIQNVFLDAEYVIVPDYDAYKKRAKAITDSLCAYQFAETIQAIDAMDDFLASLKKSARIQELRKQEWEPIYQSKQETGF